MKNLLKAVFAQLKTVPAINWIDEDFGQLEIPEGRPPVQFPCALVTIDELGDNLGGDEYDISSTITVRVAHSRFGDRSGMAPEEPIGITIKKIDDAEAVRAALTGFEVPGVCGVFYFKSMLTERRTDGIAVKSITFTETH